MLPMLTPLPYSDYHESAKCLSSKHLTRVRVHCWMIARALTRATYPYQLHPATKLWRGHLSSLVLYTHAICDEYARRGYNDDIKRRLGVAEGAKIVRPNWIGEEHIHSSHRAALLADDWEWYKKYGWTEQPSEDIIWP